jgi:hypothetical protein
MIMQYCTRRATGKMLSLFSIRKRQADLDTVAGNNPPECN